MALSKLTSGPTSLAVQDLDLVRVVSCHLLDVRQGARHVVEVRLVGLRNLGSLPVRESVGQNVGDQRGVRSVGGEQVVGGAIGELVPAVGGTDGEAGVKLLHDADVLVELSAGQVATVEGLGTDGDGLDRLLVAGDSILNGCEVLEERGVLGAHVARGLRAKPNIRRLNQYVPTTDATGGKSRLTRYPA